MLNGFWLVYDTNASARSRAIRSCTTLSTGNYKKKVREQNYDLGFADIQRIGFLDKQGEKVED